METHKFDVEDAKEHGVKKAILLEHLKFHQEANQANSVMVIDGKPYAFLRPSTIEKMYPYLNKSSVRRWLRELEDKGVIESFKPNSKKGDHLKYYHVIGHNNRGGQNDRSVRVGNDQNGRSKNSQNDRSSYITNVESTNGRVEPTDLDPPDVAEYWKEAKQISLYLLESIKEVDASHRYHSNPPSDKALFKWTKEIERAIRLDGRNPEDLKHMISILFFDNNETSQFWRGNIESGGKLRKQFDKIKFQLKRDTNYGKHQEIDQLVDSVYE